MAWTRKPPREVGNGLTAAAFAPEAIKPVPSRVASAPGLHPVPTKLAAFVSEEITGVLDWTSMVVSCVAETCALLVAVNDTEYWPTWDVCGVQLNTPVLGLKLESGGRLETDRVTASPAGSVADTVKVTLRPGTTVWSPGRVSTGGAGVKVTEACTATPWKLAPTLTVSLELTYAVEPWKLTVDCPGTVDTDAGKVASWALPEIPIATLVVAPPEFNVIWQLNGKPDCKVCGQASAVGFKANSEIVVCADEDPMFAMIVAASSWLISGLVALNGTVALPATGSIRAGTVIWVLLEESRMPGLLAVAAPESTAWQELVPPPTSVSALQFIALTDTFELAGPSSVKV